MVAGIGVTEWMNSAFGSQTMDAGMFQQTMFSDPTVEMCIRDRVGTSGTEKRMSK